MQQKQQHNRVSCIKAILPLLAVVLAVVQMQECKYFFCCR